MVVMMIVVFVVVAVEKKDFSLLQPTHHSQPMRIETWEQPLADLRRVAASHPTQIPIYFLGTHYHSHRRRILPHVDDPHPSARPRTARVPPML